MAKLWTEDADVGELLSSIHLEKYENDFRQGGYCTARDLFCLDNETLSKIGVIATGHRKRILKLAKQIQDGSLSEEGEASLDCLITEPTLEKGLQKELNDLKVYTNPTIPERKLMASKMSGTFVESIKENVAVLEKPVPKPRTVFSKTKPLTDTLPQITTAAPVSPDVSPQESTTSPFIVLEGFRPGESSTDTEDADLEELPSTKGFQKGINSWSSTESIPKPEQISENLPPVPPRIHRGIPPITFCGKAEQEENLASPLSSSPCSYSSTGETSPSAPSTPEKQVEMVPNEIYLGISHVTQEIPHPRPVPQPPFRKEANASAENISRLSSSMVELTVIPEPSSRDRVLLEEEINPYCETVFHRSSSDHQQISKNQRNTESGTCNQDHLGTFRQNCATKDGLIPSTPLNKSEDYFTVGVPNTSSQSFCLPTCSYNDEYADDLTISPYASFTFAADPAHPIISGWLEKLSPHGNCVFQRRYSKFDGKNLMYFNNEKEVYPKGVIPLAAIQMVRPAKESKFEIVTSQRIFVFRTENETQRNHWCKTLQDRVKDKLVSAKPRLGLGSQCQKSGYLELKGTKSKIYTAIINDKVWLYKNEQCFKNGIGITLIDIRGATIRESKHKTFELITPFKTFSFTAESWREKKDWMEALQESIAETLSDYEVAEKIWSNRSNKTCADCKAINPDWASINLCVVICKNCAGQHRGLGTTISKVQSLTLDTSVWSNEIVQLFIMIGNERANRFWAARLTPYEELDPDATAEQRREFIGLKYRDGRYRLPHPRFATQDDLLKALCTAVAEQNLLQIVPQIFTEAAEALDSNLYDQCQAPSLGRVSESQSYKSIESSSTEGLDTGSVYDEITQPVIYSGYLYKSASISKTSTKKNKEEYQKKWCTLDRCLLFYDSEKRNDPSLKIDMNEIICLGVSRHESPNSPGPCDRFRYTFEVYLVSEKVYQFGVETAEALHGWTNCIGKAFTSLNCHCLLAREFERVGRLKYKAMFDPEQWKEGYFVLQKSNLFICPGNEKAAEDSVNLRRLQELSVTTQMENNEKKDILVLVEKGRTLHLQGMARVDFSMWYQDIQTAAGGKGNALRDQQLSRNDIPIIVDSCIAFITQYGLRHEGIYRKNGAKSRIKLLMDEFRQDARNVRLRIGDNFIEDVTDVLKRFFREIDDPVFMAELHPLWQEAAEIPQKLRRLERYKDLIRSLPRVNRTTLAALIGHLYRVQKCADLNQMCTKNLSLLFAPSLFQTDGKGEHEVKIVEDLIDNYLYVFNIDEEQVNQMELEISLITTWKDVQLSQAGDLIIEVYLEKRLPDCCITLKVSPTMSAEELTNQVLYLRNIPACDKDIWITFEAIECGELERPLHPKEKVLEQALQWCKLPVPSSAYLVVKKIPSITAIDIFTGYKNDVVKGGMLKCREEPPKLLQGNKFQERLFQIRDRKLLLLKDKKSNKPEKEWMLQTLKVYLGIRKKLKAPAQWGFTVFLDKHQLYLCCAGETEMWDWMTSILKAQHDDLRPAVLRRHSSSDLSKQKFGTMPLVPIRGDESNSTMVSANKTLRKLHARRTLSMYFPMKMHQDSFEEQTGSAEPLYEEVGEFNLQVLKSLETSFLTGADPTTKAVEIDLTKTAPPERPVSLDQRKTASLERIINPSPAKSFSVDGCRGLTPAVSMDRLRNPEHVKSLILENNSAVTSDETFRLFPKTKSLGINSESQEKLLQELTSAIQKKSETGNVPNQTG
ncbi:arf-GAP with Rho-GAP domain, ANK repeat and PH domain-containing protein 3 [Polypterus senegalus]|uniref:arf-GAP with Rho-GAP domain, ANK repeat and PH domain-containing protein 3 n=1 Tax=Polypterus senegalus TaxID=55291 RepID=UPI001964C22F|nr:arf-GAP with Rho-GAP domain, ANK repeat and PH domain-containing protein 3 [Polypterus senegalus]XP_039630522.1 arf-GAP with Rho-GAP domain, ANK repeat and PH domain-containing protein 3 [Polypterus senegalus]